MEVDAGSFRPLSGSTAAQKVGSCDLIIQTIAKFLDEETLARSRLVNKRWHSIVDAPFSRKVPFVLDFSDFQTFTHISVRRDEIDQSVWTHQNFSIRYPHPSILTSAAILGRNRDSFSRLASTFGNTVKILRISLLSEQCYGATTLFRDLRKFKSLEELTLTGPCVLLEASSVKSHKWQLPVRKLVLEGLNDGRQGASTCSAVATFVRDWSFLRELHIVNCSPKFVRHFASKINVVMKKGGLSNTSFIMSLADMEDALKKLRTITSNTFVLRRLRSLKLNVEGKTAAELQTRLGYLEGILKICAPTLEELSLKFLPHAERTDVEGYNVPPPPTTLTIPCLPNLKEFSVEGYADFSGDEASVPEIKIRIRPETAPISSCFLFSSHFPKLEKLKLSTSTLTRRLGDKCHIEFFNSFRPIYSPAKPCRTLKEFEAWFPDSFAPRKQEIEGFLKENFPSAVLSVTYFQPPPPENEESESGNEDSDNDTSDSEAESSGSDDDEDASDDDNN